MSPVSSLEVTTNGTVKEESPQASESRSIDKDTSTQVQQHHAPPPQTPERSSDKEKEKADKDKSGGKKRLVYLTHLSDAHCNREIPSASDHIFF